MWIEFLENVHGGGNLIVDISKDTSYGSYVAGDDLFNYTHALNPVGSGAEFTVNHNDLMVGMRRLPSKFVYFFRTTPLRGLILLLTQSMMSLSLAPGSNNSFMPISLSLETS